MTSTSPSDHHAAAPRGLHHLVYFSRQAFAPGADVDFEVGEIIRASIRNNRDAAVTGLLLIHQDWFIQILEGPMKAVLTTYGRIANDPRHETPTVIDAGPCEARRFAEWNMCARRMNPSDDAILDVLDQRGLFEPHRLSKAASLQLLLAVRTIQRDALPRVMV